MSPFRRNLSQSPLLKIVSFCVVLLSILFSACATSSSQTQPLVSHAQPTSTKSISPSPTPTVSPASSASTPAVAQLRRPNLERGMIYPGWSQDSHGTVDTTWQQGIQTIQTQTMATWLEIPMLFTQSTPYSTDAGPGANTPNLTAFASGIRKAHALGYHVFFIPLMGVNTAGGWAGIIQLETQQQQQAWFANYWHTLRPYAVVAQENGVEQMSIGTELQWLEQNAPASLWETLIAQAAAYDATLSNVFADSHIDGIFFWGWAEVARLDIQGQAAVQVVHKWYTMTGK